MTSPPITRSRESLWDFALRFYSSPGVEQTCLLLQDRWGADVTLLLWLCWQEQRQVLLSGADIEVARQKVALWQQQVIAPLRQLRRQLKTDWPIGDSAVGPVRNAIKEAELRAEQTALQWLEAIEVGVLQEECLAGANLAQYLRQLAVPDEVCRESLARLSG